MRIKLLAMTSVVGWLGACAVEPVNPDTSESESELAAESQAAPSAVAGDPGGKATAELGSQAVHPHSGPFGTTVFCSSGWPGTRACNATIVTPTDIIPVSGFPFVQVTSGSGDLGHSATASGRTITFSAGIAEGDAFNPGKNSTQYNIIVLIN